jgi:hypothetical protein
MTRRRRAARGALAAALAAVLAFLPLAPVRAQDAPDAHASEGDLTHLTFTATGDLHAELVSPKDGGPFANPIEVSTVEGAGVELAVDGVVVPFDRIGKRTVNKKTGETHYFYYGAVLQPGPNAVVLTPLGANGLRGKPVRATVYGASPIVTLRATVTGRLRSDGKTAATIRVTGIDAWGHPAAAGQLVKAQVLRGDASVRPAAAPSDPAASPAPDATPAAPPQTLPASPPPAPFGPDAGGTSAAAADPTSAGPSTAASGRTDGDGAVTFALVPGLRAGDVLVHLAADDVTLDVTARVLPYLRKPIVSALVTAGAGAVPGVPGEDPHAPDGGASRFGRVALYGSGAAGSELVTVAYDSAGVLDQESGSGAFLSNPDERPYQTYGDASTRRDDALSTDRLYVRIDGDDASAMWGEFRAQTSSNGPSSLGGLDLLVNGAKATYAGAAVRATAFTARDATAYARQVFVPTGLSVLAGTLKPDIVVGSDVVELIALDRRTGAVVSDRALTRNVDYTLDYGTGDLRFINVPLPFDDDLDPQAIVVRYEYQGPAASAQTTGLRVDATFGPGGAYHAGAGFADDATGSGSVVLAGEDVGGKLPGGSWSIEHLATSGAATAYGAADTVAAATGVSGDAGDAWKAALATSFRENRLSLGIEATSIGFDDPYGGLATPGLFAMHGTFAHTIRGGDVTLAFDSERNSGTGANSTETNVSLRAHEKIGKKLSVSAGLEARTYDGGTSTSTSTAGSVPTPAPAAGGNGTVLQADVGATYRFSRVVDLEASRIADVGGSAASDTTQPAQTSAQLGVDFPNKGRAYVREIWSDAPAQSFAAATSSLEAPSLGTRATAIGFERSLGAATSIDSEYGVQSTGSGSDVYASLGVKERFLYSKRFHGDVALQQIYAVGENQAGANVYQADLTYAPNDRFKASLNEDLRTGSTPGSTFELGAAGRVSPDLSLLASIDEAHTAGFSSSNDGVGLALRPLDSDRTDALFEFRKVDGTDATLVSRTDLLSYEQFVRFGRSDLSARVAYKLDGDGYYPARSMLFGVRFATRVYGRFDIAEELRLLEEPGVASAGASGFALEAGYRLGTNVRVAGGYDFESAADPDLTSAPRRRGPYTTITSLFDSFGTWGSDK